MAKRQILDDIITFKINSSDKKKIIDVARKGYRRELSDFMRIVCEEIISGNIQIVEIK